MAFGLGRLTDANTVCDHINGVVDDNRLCNLRVVSQRENTRNQKISVNNKSTVTGVFYLKSERVFLSYITYNGKRHILGKFRTLEEAASVRRAAESHYKFHPNHGKTSEERAKTT